MSDGTGAIPDQPPLLPIKIPMTANLPPRLLNKQEDTPERRIQSEGISAGKKRFFPEEKNSRLLCR